MEQTKSLFIINKFRSVMLAVLAIEVVTFLVSLTDTLVAGSMISKEALLAIGLMSPYQFTATFLSALVNSGTLLNYTRSIGSFEKRRANEMFSHGCIIALLMGLLFAIFMIVIKSAFIDGTLVSAQTREYLKEYFDVIIWYYPFLPIYTVLDNTIMNIGGEKLSSAANIVQTVSNVLLSVLFAHLFGVKGIAAASVICQFIAMGMILIWILKKSSILHFYFSIKAHNILLILKDGLGRSVAYAMSALMVWIMNLYTLSQFGSEAVEELVVVLKTVDAAQIFMGLALSLQPFINALRWEKNTKAERDLMKKAFRIILLYGAVLSVLVIIFARLITSAFGLDPDSSGASAVLGVRLTGAVLAVSAVLKLFFVYYFLTGMHKCMYAITILNDLVFPVILGILGAVIFGSPEGIWIGLAAAPVFTLAVCAAVIRRFYGKDRFPFLIPLRDESRIFIYDFPLNTENCIAMAETAGTVLASEGYPAKSRIRVEAFTEDTLILILNKNASSDKKLSAEYTIILEDDGIRLILRDSGVLFDFTDEDIDSFRRYFVSQILTVPISKQYIISAGYNRSEFFFAKENL